MKVKIDSINRTLRNNLEQRKKDSINTRDIVAKTETAQIVLNSLPEVPESTEHLNVKGQVLSSKLKKITTSSIMKLRTWQLQKRENELKIKTMKKQIQQMENPNNFAILP
jgi:MinD-like ATPase involved in chromosome partitioning or flagellar assembly